MGRTKIAYSKKRKKHSLSFDDVKYGKIQKRAKSHKKSVSRFIEAKALDE
jgi:hypothetical protein